MCPAMWWLIPRMCGIVPAICGFILAKCGRSVNRGWNCIDTAANYRSGRGEAAVGHALLALRIANVGITRNMLFVS